MRIGVFGLGSIGMRHALNARALGHEVLGFDPDQTKMTKLQGGIIAPQDIYATCSAAIIASPTDSHLRDLELCIDAGIHCLVEKPISNARVRETLSVVDRAAANNLTVMVGYNLRFRSCVRAANQWISSSKIGDILWAHFCCAQQSNREAYLRDGVIHNWSHEIDLANYLLGQSKIVWCAADAKNECADIIVRHHAGCYSVIHLDYLTPDEFRRFVICGTHGRIEVDIPANRAILTTTNDVTQTLGPDTFDDNYVSELKEFLKKALGYPVVGAVGATGYDGIAALKICNAAKGLAGIE